MNWQDHIISDKGILLGKPMIKGTRLSIEHLVGLFAQGWSEEQVLQSYPRLTKDGVQAVFAYMYECMQDGLFMTSLKKSS
jgi:uncharacterized protein (DUF433 family)